MKNLARRNIRNLVAYKSGKPINEVKRELGLKRVIKLASNESPLISFRVKNAIKRSISEINRYPEGSCFYLRQKLSKKFGLKPGNFVFGNGSDELIDVIIKTFVEQDEEIITSKISFLEYEIVAKINARRVITVPLKSFKYDLKAIKQKITAKTKVIFIANPNNPTGTYVNAGEVREFLTGLPANVIVVFDEAYNEFVDAPDFPDTFCYLNKKNVIILRTFSKVYGMAGLRIGYAVAEECLTKFMERVRPPFNVNSIAQASAAAALSDTGHVSAARKITLAQKKYLYDALDRLGVAYIPSAANFILIKVAKNTVTVFREMLRYGVIVRDMEQYGLNNYIRVTIGKPGENRKFIEVFKKLL